MKVFVSYSRHDTEFVTRLHRELGGLGHDVWIDTEDIFEGGQDRWRRSIVAAIRDSDVMVLVLSPSSTHSENVERELSVAADNAKRVIPVVYQECELPDGFQYELAGVQHVDFSTTDFKEGVRQLAAFLGSPYHVATAAVVASPRPAAPAAATTRRRQPSGLVIAGVSVAAVLIGVIVVAAATGGDGSSVSTDVPRVAAATIGSAESSAPTVAPTAVPTVATTPTAVTGAVPTDSPTTTAVASEPAPPSDPSRRFCIRADIDFAALRSSPDLSSALLVQVPAGSCNAVLLDDAPITGGSIDWYHVEYDGADGWTATTNAQARCVRADIDFSALRADTDRSSALLAQIPAAACGVLMVDPAPTQAGGIAWLHVLWNGQQGWTAETNMQ